ncbi:LLM class flavin-dependent oxidoreductase [Actinobacteria bacterium YIM 96077]|uniref:LLM class F420-dependent oxidoreductase n=1 Tax=Phytoactinopolyspora halophila TaxID=1981511 RepID=A0A329QHV2_9ACTN|nr:LLM class flavin-dependent oxidoreductase [Phytoactinopolyspora halophila]AYY14367.1 LLM class flavin-dependent oxidoreductase [Actinobacteria bacterium YIM 96077]RAW11910.1 LLM class F420-dependent oxidoreductase [Phytoactinopolyspora halophila]
MKLAWLCSHESYQPEVLLDHAVLAEQSGFDAVTGADHFHPWVDDASASSFVWSWFGAAAQATSRVELATSVTAPLYRYHPGLIAQAAATLDRLSGGRFILGVGTGEAINEAPLGYAFPGYRERIARMEEALRIIHGLLAGEKLDIDGEYYRAQTAKLYSPPVGNVPVWMAAGGPKSATFAGQHAEGLITSVKDPADALERVIGPYREAAAARGASTTIMATRWVVLASSDDEAWEALAPMRGLRAPGRLETADPMVLRERADAMDRQEILGKYTVVRDLEGLAEAYRPLVSEVGADYVAIQVASAEPASTIKQIGSQVLPALRDWAGTG